MNIIDCLDRRNKRERCYVLGCHRRGDLEEDRMKVRKSIPSTFLWGWKQREVDYHVDVHVNLKEVLALIRKAMVSCLSPWVLAQLPRKSST